MVVDTARNTGDDARPCYIRFLDDQTPDQSRTQNSTLRAGASGPSGHHPGPRMPMRASWVMEQKESSGDWGKSWYPASGEHYWSDSPDSHTTVAWHRPHDRHTQPLSLEAVNPTPHDTRCRSFARACGSRQSQPVRHLRRRPFPAPSRRARISTTSESEALIIRQTLPTASVRSALPSSRWLFLDELLQMRLHPACRDSLGHASIVAKRLDLGADCMGDSLQWAHGLWPDFALGCS